MEVKHLIFGSGGLRGINMIGVLKKISDDLKMNNKPFISAFNLQSITGTSIGSVISILISLYYSVEEIMILMLNINWIETLKSKGIPNLLENFGCISRDNLFVEMRSILYNKIGKSKITFLELFNYNGINFNVVATDINSNEMVIFNHTNYPDVDVIDAVNASCTIPIIFEPIKINDMCLVDGAIVSSFPIDVSINLAKDIKDTDMFLAMEPNDSKTIDDDIYSKTNLNNFSLEIYITNILKTIFKQVTKPKEYNYKNNVKIIQVYSKFDTFFMAYEKDDIHQLFNEGYKLDIDFILNDIVRHTNL